MNVNIRDLLNNIEDSSVELEEKDVVSSDRIKELTKMKLNNDTTTKIVKSSKKKIITVSIVAAVIGALGLSTYAAFGGLDNTTFGKSSWFSTDEDVAILETKDVGGTEDHVELIPHGGATKATENAESDVIPSQEMISLQGFSDSPEYKAAQEWNQFVKSYDRESKILDAYDKKVKKTGKDKFEKKYGAYGVYSQEMADKVDEIAKKYDLKLHKPGLGDAREDGFNAKFDNFIKPGVTCGGYYYEDGTIGFDGKYKNINFQFSRNVKGYFDTVTLNIGDKSGYDQWTYKTKDGYTAYISLGSKEGRTVDTFNPFIGKGIILIDLEGSFVSLNVLPYDDDGNFKDLSKADLEELVEQFDLSKL